jgi:hypothetical protein
MHCLYFPGIEHKNTVTKRLQYRSIADLDNFLDADSRRLETVPQPSPLCKGCGPIEFVPSAAPPSEEICGRGGQIAFQIFTTIIMRALSIVHYRAQVEEL